MSALYQIIETGVVSLKFIRYFDSKDLSYHYDNGKVCPRIGFTSVEWITITFNLELELKSIYELRFTNAISNH